MSYIIILGNPLYGGETVYYSGMKQETSSDIEKKISFHHCRLPIGSFEKINM